MATATATATATKIIVNKQPFWVADAETEFPRLKTEPDKANLIILKDLAEYQWICDFITHWYIAPISKYVDNNDTNKSIGIDFCQDTRTHGGFLIKQTIDHYRRQSSLYSRGDIQPSIDFNFNGDLDEAMKKNLNYELKDPINYGGDVLIVSESADANKVIAEINARVGKYAYNGLILSRSNLEAVTTSADESAPAATAATTATNYVSWRIKGPYALASDWWLSHSSDVAIPAAIANSAKLQIDPVAKEITFGNLLALCMMVKNAGEQFEETLRHNLALVDYWVIIDTGSTDTTKDTIRRVTAEMGIPGLLHEENIAIEDLHFDKVRNQCLDLAGRRCLYALTLDDTYRITPSIRQYMIDLAGDQIADSISCYINSKDMYYASNRIVKTCLARQYRYIYRIHEVIDTTQNFNVIIPFEKVYIADLSFKYMDDRTLARKQYEIQWLNEELAMMPNDPRPFYYLGQAYRLLEDYEKAFEYLVRRASFTTTGFLLERYDAAFEAARISNFNLKHKWEQSLYFYNLAMTIYPQRPEPYYFIGIHYLLENNPYKAFEYMKQAFQYGIALDSQFNIKPTLAYYFVPLNIVRLAYLNKEYVIGAQATALFLTHYSTCIKLTPELDNPQVYNEVIGWHNIYRYIVGDDGAALQGVGPAIASQKPIAVFVADGGYKEWSGTSIITEGVGGSETFIIEMARNMQASGNFQVYVFCKCPTDIEIFEGVTYQPLSKLSRFVHTHQIHSCIISRFVEYLPVAYTGNVENVYCILHDVTPIGNVFINHPKLKAVYCLTEWHCEVFAKQWPMYASLARPFYYGVDKRFVTATANGSSGKKKWSFIYSSFPNRGLLQLLQMWGAIRAIQPKATLDIYCDLNHKWTNEFAPEQMQAIRELLAGFTATAAAANDADDESAAAGITVHGWVDKAELAVAWKRAHIWLYPCTFAETFCLTALEAAASGTFVVTNDLAALQYTVGDRGLVIKGDAATPEWQAATLEAIEPFLRSDSDAVNMVTNAIQRNHKWSTTLSWPARAKDMCAQWLSSYSYKQSYLCLRGCNADNVVWEKIKETVGGESPVDTTNVLEVNTLTGMGLVHLLPHLKSVKNVVLLENMQIYGEYSTEMVTSLTHNINKYLSASASASATQPEVSMQQGEILHSLTLLSIKYLNKMGVISYYCNSSPDIVGHLHMLYSLLAPSGILILNVYDHVEQLPLINYFFNSYKKPIKSIYEVNINNTEMVLILKKG